MVLVPSWLRSGAMIMLALAALSTGCHKKASLATDDKSYVTVSGVVTYTRVPMRTDSATGVPLGLETDSTKFTTPVARQILVRFFQQKEEKAADGTVSKVWLPGGTATTTDEGKWSMSIEKDSVGFIQLESSYEVPGSTSVQIFSDPVDCGLPVASRYTYAIRKGFDGTPGTLTAPLPVTKASSSLTLDFKVGLDDAWLTVPQAWWSPAPGATFRPMESVTAGSRILAILDDCYTMYSNYGTAAPSGGPLALHYRPGVTNARGTFVEYDRDLYPGSIWSGGGYTFHYAYGAVRGGTPGDASTDDAYHQGATLVLLARNSLTNSTSGTVGQRPVGKASTALSPDVALLEGFADAMAATILKTPYLTSGGPGGLSVRDIRDLSDLPASQVSLYSARAIAALAWELTLKARAIAAPGTPTQWSAITVSTLARFYAPLLVKDTNSLYPIDTANLYTQVGRLQESLISGEPVDLKAIFTDAVLTPLLASYNVAWPRPKDGTGNVIYLMDDWGTDPDSLAKPLPSLSFDMALAQRVPVFDGTTVQDLFPDCGYAQVRYVRFLMDKDVQYNLWYTAVPALPANAVLEVYNDSTLGTSTVTFPASEPGKVIGMTMRGSSTADITQYHALRFRLKSPDTRIPPTTLTFHLDKVASRIVP